MDLWFCLHQMVATPDLYIAIAKPDKVINFFGKKAALISYNESMWDILVIEDTKIQKR